MEVQFFSQLAELIEGADLNINISKKEGIVMVSVLPKSKAKDKALNLIKPLIMSGTADELDKGFIEAITRPVTEAKGFMHNVSEFEKSIEEARKKSEIEKQKADKVKAEKASLAKAAEKEQSNIAKIAELEALKKELIEKMTNGDLSPDTTEQE